MKSPHLTSSKCRRGSRENAKQVEYGVTRHLQWWECMIKNLWVCMQHQWQNQVTSHSLIRGLCWPYVIRRRFQSVKMPNEQLRWPAIEIITKQVQYYILKDTLQSMDAFHRLVHGPRPSIDAGGSKWTANVNSVGVVNSTSCITLCKHKHQKDPKLSCANLSAVHIAIRGVNYLKHQICQGRAHTCGNRLIYKPFSIIFLAMLGFSQNGAFSFSNLITENQQISNWFYS